MDLGGLEKAVEYIRRGAETLVLLHALLVQFFLVQVSAPPAALLASAMDVDWCLSCERKLVCSSSLVALPRLQCTQDDLPSESGPYCSPECLSYAQPSSPRAHASPLATSGAYRIRQWARAIPPHIPAGAPTLPFADLPPSSSPVSTERPPSPRQRYQPTPKLIERTAASTLPTLCISSPTHVRPPHPARAPPHSYSRPTNTTTCMSEASTSLTSLLSEPMVATPDEDASFGANIGALVRSWVNCDRAHSAKSTKEDCIIEKVTDYFPPLLHGKKPPPPPSSSKNSKKTPPQSPAPAFRHKLSAKKVVPFLDRDRSTSTHSHTPTPVIFPSCRAADLDWVDGDEDEDELVIAPQPQYHPTYYRKHEPQWETEPVHWTRAPSLSSSVSSSSSSVLLMAPKFRDNIRGRKDTRAIAA